jgi:hypothetical protein
MKRWMLIIFLVVLMVVPFTSVHAINLNNESPHILADFMPDSTAIFAGTRIGADFVAELDAIFAGLASKLPASLAAESYSLDNTFRNTLAKEGQDWDRMIGLVGNYAAVGIEPVGSFNSGEQPIMIAIAEITDQAGVEQFLLEIAKDSDKIPERQMDGDTILYIDETSPVKIMITPTHFILTNNMDYSPNVEAPLSASADFTEGLNLLTADTYSTLVYVSEATTEAMLSQSNNQDLQKMGLNPTDAGAMTLGFTILAGNTFTMDVAVQGVTPMPTSTVSIDFLNALPASTDTFIVASDITNVYNSVVEGIQAAARANDEQDPTAQIPLMFNFTGLDLEEDVLSWTTGNYGVFMGADFISLFEGVMTTGSVSNLELDAGIVIEATDVALAQNAASELGDFMSMALASEKDVTITQDDTSTSIIVELPMNPSMPPLELEFVLTTTDDFFFFGTRSALDKIMSGDTLAKNADFAKSTQYFLENPTSVWYTNSDGVVVSTAVPLVIMGPAIGNVFENIVAELNSDGSGSSSSSNSGGLDLVNNPEVIMEILNVYDDIFSSMTLTSSIDAEGVIRMRGTLSLNP